MYKLGIDVGGTNTDAVLVDENRAVVADIKYPTSADIYDGILGAMRTVLEVSGVDPAQIHQAMLGTTQCTNAIVERKNLAPIGILRIGAPATTGIRPMVDWSEDIQKVAVGSTITMEYTAPHGAVTTGSVVFSDIANTALAFGDVKTEGGVPDVEAAKTLLGTYYASYLDAVNKQDIAAVLGVTEVKREDLKSTLSSAGNLANVFSFTSAECTEGSLAAVENADLPLHGGFHLPAHEQGIS